MTRCFIAINIPPEIKAEISKIINQLKQKNSSWAIKYVKPEGIHLTLHFLGYLDDNQIEQVQQVLAGTVKLHQSFELGISDFGGFPNLHRPRVLFIEGVGETEAAKKLQQNLGEKLQTLGLEIDRRPWQVHFTLARIKEGDIGQCRLQLGKIKVPPMKFLVKNIELMKSTLTPQGARYAIISSHPLNSECRGWGLRPDGSGQGPDTPK